MGTGAKDRLILAEPPKSTPKNFDQQARDKAWALYHWTRLYRAFGGEEYGVEIDKIIRQIQSLQDQASKIERSQTEECPL